MDVEKLIRLRSTIAALLQSPGEPLAAESLAVQVGELRRQVYLALAGGDGDEQLGLDAGLDRRSNRSRAAQGIGAGAGGEAVAGVSLTRPADEEGNRSRARGHR